MTKYNKIFKTVSLGNEMTRGPEGKKYIDGKRDTEAIKKVGWVISNKESGVMAAVTGPSKIIAIDLDGTRGEELFNKLLKLDPDCKYVAKSVDKGGGHFLYKVGDTETLDETIPNENGCNIENLDLQRGNKILYLATPGNKTKELLTKPISSHAELTTMPEVVQLLIANHYMKMRKAAPDSRSQIDIEHKDSKLHYLVKAAVESGKYHSPFFNVITTKTYKEILTREENQVETDKKYHPNNLPESSPTQYYFVSIATILGRDPSVDEDLFKKAMFYINSLFTHPRPTEKLDGIIEYIVSGKSKIGDKQVWNYNKDWDKKGLTYVDVNNASHEVFCYDEAGSIFYLDYNHLLSEYVIYKTVSHLLDNIAVSSLRGTTYSKQKALSLMLKVSMVQDVNRPFGFFRTDLGSFFNTNKWTPEQRVLRNPRSHEMSYKKPVTTLKFLENSMGKDRLYNFFLPFMKRKFTTYDFSPLIMVMYGPPHSGKSAIPNGILAPFMPRRYISLSSEVASDKYDNWKLNKDIAFLDEIHHTRADVLEKIINIMNRSSEKLVGVRAMYRDADSEEHKSSLTYMLACNSVVPLATEAKDRRLVILRSKMSASEALGMDDEEIMTKLKEEGKDFAYYLATMVESLELAKYRTNSWLKDNAYNTYMKNSLSEEKAMTASVVNQNWLTFEELMLDFKLDEDDIVRSSISKKTTTEFVIHNSNEDDCHRPGLLQGAMNEKQLFRELNSIHSDMVKVRRVDMYKGVRKKNKKTYVIFNNNRIPEYIKKKLRAAQKQVEVTPVKDPDVSLAEFEAGSQIPTTTTKTKIVKKE